jgi:hypothetical protein
MNERTRSGRFASLLVALAAQGGCLSATAPTELATFEAPLLPVAGATDPVSGSAAMVVLENETHAGLGVTGATEATMLDWTVRTGTCASPGSPLAASGFARITIGATGAGNAEAVIPRSVDPAARYSVVVFDVAGSQDAIACADLVRID